MAIASNPAELIAAFGKTIGVDNLAFNADNEARIILNDRFVDIRYDADRDAIQVGSPIANIAGTDTGVAFANILELNLAHALTGNGTVGFDRRENKLYYINEITVTGIGADMFSRFMMASFRMMEVWVRAVNARAFFEEPMSFGERAPPRPVEQPVICRV